MPSAINSICSKLQEVLKSDTPETVRGAIAEMGGDETDLGLTRAARYITEAFYAFGVSEDELCKWDAPHLVLVGHTAKGLEKFEESIRISFYSGYDIEVKPEGGTRLNLSGPVISPAIALSDGRRVDLIAKYLQRLVDCLRDIEELSFDAASKQPAATEGGVSPSHREFIDDYLTAEFADKIKPHYVQFPKMLKALSRNYYFVPDTWVEYVPHLQIAYDEATGTISINRPSLDRLRELRGEIEKEIWRIANQPGYLTTDCGCLP